MVGLRSAWSRVGIVVLGLIGGAARDESRGQDITPDRIGFDYETIRGLLPEDGKLIEKGVIPRNYVGFALGYEVKADGRKVVVRSKLGSPGVVLGEGYIKLHLGVHVVQEPLGGGPPVAFNIVAGVILTVDDQLKVTLEVPDDDLRIEGDNWGGRAVAALKREELRRIVRSKLGSPGVVLGEGYIKLHLGAHVEQEPLGGGPPLAFNIVAGVILTVDDQLKVTLEVPDDDLRIEGDNWEGRAVAASRPNSHSSRPSAISWTTMAAAGQE